MTKNMGTVDRALRVTAAIIIGYLYYSGRISGTLGIILCVLAVVWVLTSLVSWCPGYLPFGISTRGRGDGAQGTS